ncbi:MAG: DUF86 domain-containing protein [bacterium]|nr:DUF86 domain-containing protein [bacterium]
MLRADDQARLRHMLDASRKAIAYVAGGRRGDLDRDEKLSLALVRLLEIIGEAAGRVSPETQRAYPEFPWRQIAATRNRLIHGYFDVDLDIVWTIVTHDLPGVVSSLERMLS